MPTVSGTVDGLTPIEWRQEDKYIIDFVRLGEKAFPGDIELGRQHGCWLFFSAAIRKSSSLVVHLAMRRKRILTGR